MHAEQSGFARFLVVGFNRINIGETEQVEHIRHCKPFTQYSLGLQMVCQTDDRLNTKLVISDITQRQSITGCYRNNTKCSAAFSKG
jgi:hypothetical protein